MLVLGTDKPCVAPDCFVAHNATLIGKVTLGGGASVWFNAVLRGDVGPIEIGAGANVQDGVVMHMPWGGSVTVGEESTIGHCAIIHGCAIGKRVLIGMGAIVMDGARIGDECIIAAGTVLTPNTVMPARSLVMGTPGRIVRPLAEHEIADLGASARDYAALAARYRAAALVEDD